MFFSLNVHILHFYSSHSFSHISCSIFILNNNYKSLDEYINEHYFVKKIHCTWDSDLTSQVHYKEYIPDYKIHTTVFTSTIETKYFQKKKEKKKTYIKLMLHEGRTL